MRQLSERAINYLQTLKRSKDAVIDRQQLEQYFQSQQVPIFNPVIEYGVFYSGFTLNSKTKKSDSFSTFLVYTDDIKQNREFEFEKKGDTYLFYCGQHETAQFYFYINHKGEFCSDGYEGANILSSSFEVEIEQYAYKSVITDWQEYPFYYSLVNDSVLQSILANDFEIVQECTDNYNGWYKNENIIIQKGTWLHEKSFYLHFYGQTKSELEQIVNDYIKKGIIK